ncbi:hypothetical protein CL651_004195 [bacterium]|nr:hypothetical protein [bacterium]|tara:strand:- start:15 stop:368 length:354 start_codon:yes stop_codon:yes gene_type:complete
MAYVDFPIFRIIIQSKYMRSLTPFLLIYFVLLIFEVRAEEIVFFETVPTIGKIIMMGVAIGIPTFIILSHVPLFELLDTDKLPEPPKIKKAQMETLKGTLIGIVFGLLITVVTIILS